MKALMFATHTQTLPVTSGTRAVTTSGRAEFHGSLPRTTGARGWNGGDMRNLRTSRPSQEGEGHGLRFTTGRARPLGGWCAPWFLLLLPLGAAGAAPSTAAPPAPAAPIELRLPADIVYRTIQGRDSAVVFSHQTHVALAENRCTGCHPQTFPMLKRGPLPLHSVMNGGGSCGTCHDGKQAFAVTDSSSCRTCHTGTRPAAASAAPTAAGATAAKLPAPHTYPPSENSPGPVTFRHQSHMRGDATCASCHPKRFRMAATAPRPGGGMHERDACGACHDGKRAFAAEDPETCTRCHRENGAGR